MSEAKSHQPAKLVGATTNLNNCGEVAEWSNAAVSNPAPTQLRDLSIFWRDARVVESDGLENRCGRKSILGSNPSLSVSLLVRGESFLLRHFLGYTDH